MRKTCQWLDYSVWFSTIRLIPLLFQYVRNLYHNETMVPVVIYFTRSPGLKMISTIWFSSNHKFTAFLCYQFLQRLYWFKGPICLQIHFDFYSLGVSDKKCHSLHTFTLHFCFFYTVHLPATLHSGFLLLHNFTYPGRWNMPSNNKEHHQESSFSCLRYELKKLIVSAHKWWKHGKLLIWKENVLYLHLTLIQNFSSILQHFLNCSAISVLSLWWTINFTNPYFMPSPHTCI